MFSSSDPSSPLSSQKSSFDSALDKNEDETVSDVLENFHPLSPPSFSSKISSSPRSSFDSALDKNKDETVLDVPEKFHPLSRTSSKISSSPRSLIDSALGKNEDETVSDAPEKFHLLSPPSSKVSSSPRSSFESALDKNEDETVLDVPEKFRRLSPPSSDKTYLQNSPNYSFHSLFDMNKNETSSDASENSSLLSSPTYSFDTTSDMDENEIVSRIPKRYLSLPYFYLPKPDFETFLTETEKNLHIPETQTNVPGFPQKIFEPKDKGDIVFTLETDTLKDNGENSRNEENCSDYQRMLSSLAKLDDCKTPGIKRLVLQDFLKRKIEEKKVLSFERKVKELAQADKEEESENEEEILLESGSSEDEDTEEVTVSFDKGKKTKDDKLKHFCTDSLELSKYSDNINNDDDVVDDFVVRKARKVCVLESDSSDESHVGDDRSDGSKHHLMEDIQFKCKTSEEINENITNHRKNHIEVDSRLSTDVPVYSSDPSKVSDCENKDNFQGSSAQELTENSHGFIEALDEDIMSSIPSYQPGGGFRQQEDINLDYSEIVTSERMQTHDKYLFTENSDSSRSNTPVPKATPSKFKYSPNFGLTLDDPPISQQGSVSGLFSSQDLDEVCSGVFKVDSPEETRYQKKAYKKCGLTIKPPKIHDYFDVEAEFSGDDDESDEDEDVDCDEAGLDLVDDDELPSAEELRDEIADLHRKQMQDDDDEHLKQIQEKLLDDGELNTDIDGSRRTRKYAWINNNTEDAIFKDSSSESVSDDDNDAVDETLCSMDKDKVKWLQEKAESDLSEELCLEYKPSKKSRMKIHIIGKPEFDKGRVKSSEHLPYKRSHGSLLPMDGNESSRMLKKLKASEAICTGSRTTKLFLFRNKDTAKATEEAVRDAGHASGSGSIFNVI